MLNNMSVAQLMRAAELAGNLTLLHVSDAGVRKVHMQQPPASPDEACACVADRCQHTQETVSPAHTSPSLSTPRSSS